jgi:hypothetical protein
MPERWLRLDELENAIDNLQMIPHFLEHFSTDLKWKWAIISLHQALYSFLVCGLKGTDAKQTVYDKTKDSVRAIILYSRNVPVSVIANAFGVSNNKVEQWLGEPYLISIQEALKRAKNQSYLTLAISKPLVTSHEEDQALEKLINEFRNEFEHFTPKHWSIEVSGMPTLFIHILRVIKFLALESESIIYPDEKQQRRVQAILIEINDQLQQNGAG